jgi:hypothetical protein
MLCHRRLLGEWFDAVPIIGENGELHGVMRVFWEV